MPEKRVVSAREVSRTPYTHDSGEEGNTLSFSLFFKDDPKPRILDLHYSTSFRLLGYAIDNVPGTVSTQVRELWQSLLLSTSGNTYCELIPKEYKLQPTKKNQDDTKEYARSFWQILPITESAFKPMRAHKPEGISLYTKCCTLDLDDDLTDLTPCAST